MSNTFVALPSPLGNGVGAAVNVSAMGGTKTIVVGGVFNAQVTIEIATDTAGTNFAAARVFQGAGDAQLDIAATWMRVRYAGWKIGAAVVSVGGNGDGTVNAQLDVPAVDGVGAVLDISALPGFKTVVVPSGFSGILTIELSEDNVAFEAMATFQLGGQQTFLAYAKYARVRRGSVKGGTLPDVWIAGTSQGASALPTTVSPAFSVQTLTIYARPTGSDVFGTGTLANPYATMQKASSVIPIPNPPGVRYVVDMTGCTEVLPADYTLPAFKAPWTTDSTLVGDPDFLFIPAVNIMAIPQLAGGAFAGQDTVPVADVVSQIADSVSKLIRITFATPRASWAANALRGYFIEDSVGGGDNCVIWQSDATHLVICAAGALNVAVGTSWRITKPGATIRGTSSSNTVATGSARGCLRAVNCDSIGFSGLDIANSAGLAAPGLALGGNGSMFAQMCWLSSPITQSWSPALARHVRCWIKGAPSYSNFMTIQQSLCDTWTGNNWVNLIWATSRGTVYDACAPLESLTFFPGIAAVAAPVLMWNFLNCVIANTPGAAGDGLRLHGSAAQLTAVDIYNCGRDGIRVSGGAGRVQLTGVGTTSADGAAVIANAAFGLNVQDGMSVAADATTFGNAKPLKGTGANHDISVGALAASDWATFAAGTKNLLDITAVAAGGATGSASRLYGN